MGKLSILAVAVAAVVTAGSLAWTAHAQTMRGMADMKAATQNFTPIQKAACGGYTGAYGCGPGWTWRWGRRGWACYRCW
jgi:hypothetical protein